jgi:hypothetical protein
MPDSREPKFSPSEIASLRWMAHIGRIQCVPWDHVEALYRAGYITHSLMDPVTTSGLERLDRERNVFRVTMNPAETAEATAERTLSPRFWIATILACITGFICVITPIWSGWIEAVFKVDVDNGDAVFEWMIVAASFVITVVLYVIAASEWTQRRTTSHHSTC